MMKIKTALLVCLLVVVTTSCKKKKIEKVQGAMTAGTWHVTTFTHDAQNLTASYANYTFTFASDGTMEATDTSTTSGSWNVVKETGGGVDNYLSFIINMPDPLNELSEVWGIEAHEDNKLELSGTGTNGSDIDVLIFEKD